MSTQGFDILTNLNFGSMMIAIAISLVLFGAAVVQGYIYFQSSYDDYTFLKIIASTVLILESLHSGLITYTMYNTTITLRGYTPAGPNSYALTATIIPEILITAFVQGFFAFRIYRLSGVVCISLICCILSLIRLGGGFALSVEGFIDASRVPNTVLLAARYNWLITLVFIVGACVDVLIAGSLYYWLKRLMSNKPLKSTSELVDRLVTLVIQTGMITSMASVASVVFFHTSRHSEIWFAIYVVTAKLYSNSFFASLNMRRQLRDKCIVEIYPSTFEPRENINEHQILHMPMSNYRESYATSGTITPPRKLLSSSSSRESFQSRNVASLVTAL